MIFINNIPYTYLIGWTKLNIWYYGRQTAKDCHPNNFWVSYFTSSEYVYKFREVYGDPDIIQIRKTFADSNYNIRVARCAKWEEKVLNRMNAVRSQQWLNESNSNRDFNTAGMTCVKDRVGNIMLVPVDDSRLLIGELVGINAGITHKITECQYCNSVIGINNIKVHEKSCKHNPDRVPGRLAGKKLNSKIGTCIYCGRTGPQHGITRHETSCLNNPNRLPGTSTGVNYTINSANCQYCNKHGSKSGITRHEKSCMENPNRTVRKNKPRINDK
jgi:hypothetical protein